MIYAGIGSRQTPSHVLDLMQRIGEICGRQGDVLRSGAAVGADSAFEAGCDMAGGRKEIFLPWNNFNGRSSMERGVWTGDNPKAHAMAKQFHPNWGALTSGGRALHARNMHQILGMNLDKPADLVICWTPNGSGIGGTGQAIRVANAHRIPVHDLGKQQVYDKYIAAVSRHPA